MHEFKSLHERHDRMRSARKTVTVDRQARIHILMDHARMLEALCKAGRVTLPNMNSALPGTIDPLDRDGPVGAHRDFQHFVPCLSAAHFCNGEEQRA